MSGISIIFDPTALVELLQKMSEKYDLGEIVRDDGISLFFSSLQFFYNITSVESKDQLSITHHCSNYENFLILLKKIEGIDSERHRFEGRTIPNSDSDFSLISLPGNMIFGSALEIYFCEESYFFKYKDLQSRECIEYFIYKDGIHFRFCKRLYEDTLVKKTLGIAGVKLPISYFKNLALKLPNARICPRQMPIKRRVKGGKKKIKQKIEFKVTPVSDKVPEFDNFVFFQDSAIELWNNLFPKNQISS